MQLIYVSLIMRRFRERREYAALDFLEFIPGQVKTGQVLCIEEIAWSQFSQSSVLGHRERFQIWKHGENLSWNEIDFIDSVQ